jgi:hypothetical protein
MDVKVDLSRSIVDAGGATIPIELDPSKLPTEGAITIEAPPIGRGRHLAHVRVPAKDSDVEGIAWEAIFAPGHPKPIFAGITGFSAGDPGERTGKSVQVMANGDTRYVIVGDIREELRICGQAATLLDPLVVYPESLELRPATVQRLGADQQRAADALVAQDKGPHADAPLAKLLVALGSSVPGSRGVELTDGDVKSVWSEQRPGAGQGEFVVMAAPKDVPIARMQIVVSPPTPDADTAAPKTLYLVTSTHTFRVTLPNDGWSKPGDAYEITFPHPIETSCLTLVLDTAFGRGLAHPTVGIAELVAYSEFDAPGVTLDEVAKKLSSERGPAAAQVLERSGEAALPAVAAAYNGLDARGRALAIDVAASHQHCDEAAPLLARGLCEKDGEAPRKAREKIERCRGAAPVLAKALQTDAAQRACIAPVLAALAPDQALVPIADAMGSTDAADRATREVLRSAFSEALQAAPQGSLSALLGDAHRSTDARLEIMRAAGPRVREAVAEADSTLADLLRGAPPMRTRFLVLEPLGSLAQNGDRAAAARIADAVAHDADWPVRARAAELGARLPEAHGSLISATRDPEPRVREAALTALSAAPSAEGTGAAMEALSRETWPFVKAQAVSVLLGSGASSAVDDALGGVLGDSSARVRGAAVVALARRRAASWHDAIRKRLDDPNEETEVRAAAAGALGAMCDGSSADRLTELARGLLTQPGDEDAQQLGLGALVGLAALQPKDLGSRIAPLLAQSAPANVRVAAQRAMAARSACR